MLAHTVHSCGREGNAVHVRNVLPPSERATDAKTLHIYSDSTVGCAALERCQASWESDPQCGPFNICSDHSTCGVMLARQAFLHLMPDVQCKQRRQYHTSQAQCQQHRNCKGRSSANKAMLPMSQVSCLQIIWSCKRGNTARRAGSDAHFAKSKVLAEQAVHTSYQVHNSSKVWSALLHGRYASTEGKDSLVEKTVPQTWGDHWQKSLKGYTCGQTPSARKVVSGKCYAWSAGTAGICAMLAVSNFMFVARCKQSRQCHALQALCQQTRHIWSQWQQRM